jgi:hypothetical protein
MVPLSAVHRRCVYEALVRTDGSHAIQTKVDTPQAVIDLIYVDRVIGGEFLLLIGMPWLPAPLAPHAARLSLFHFAAVYANNGIGAA